jgi:hypothetical protein
MMKPQKGFDWFKLVTTSMFVVGGAGILFFLIVSLTVFNEEPQTSETVVNSDEQTEETSPGRVSRPAEEGEPIQQAESGESEASISESKDAGMNEQDDSLTELKTENDSDESDEDFSKAGSLEDDDVESTGLTPEQQQRLVEIEVELAALVDRHKSLRDLIIELSYIGAPRDHLRKERWDLEKPMYILAFEYNRMVPGAIFPDGKIGRILEGVGWHFSPE